MIRPITCVGFVLACASGLYLYQAKHRVNVIDQEIARTVHMADTTREQIRLLHAEWTLLNQPDRLQKLADQFLPLKPTSPSQFTSLADLDSRLPPVRPDTPPAPVSIPSPDAVAMVALPPAPGSVVMPPKLAVVAEKRPESSRPIPRPVERARVVAAEPRPFRPVQQDYAMQPPPPAPMRPAYIPAAAPRPYWAEPHTAMQPGYTPQAQTGSVLGIAHQQAQSAPPAPVPMTSWGNGN